MRAPTPSALGGTLTSSISASPQVDFTPRLSARGVHKVPFLPGHTAKEFKTTHKKSQTLIWGLNGPFIGKNGPLPKLDLKSLESLCDPNSRYDHSTRSLTHDERASLKESARNTHRPAIPPAWLKHDRQVLRFAAYFKEPVHENPKENFRVRHCTIYFYLEDGTLMVSEPKIDNSGIPQGTFVKRHRIPKPNGDFFAVKDLGNAKTIEIYSRAFRIYDCDDFTREFYGHAVGIQLEEPEEPPMDAFKQGLLDDAENSSQVPTRDSIENKEYVELAIGGNRKNAKLQQYLENDRRVLRFQAFWDDPTPYGLRNYFTVHYYLADDSVEILENLPRNSGRDPYPAFWRKCPLRKNPHMNPAPGMIEPEADLYKPEDFIVGETVNVHGRHVYLYDCDDFTRIFFREYMGLEQDKMIIKGPDPVHPQLQYPPHTGFGHEEDSLASCLRVTTHRPTQNIKKMLSHDGKVLRFEAIMANGMQEDGNRKFVVIFYLADDSIGVWEKRQRNSGHASGKFASKSQKKNPATGRTFLPQDFYVGSVVEISGVPFLLIGVDAATVAYMEENCQGFPVADQQAIVKKLAPVQEEIAKAISEGTQECSLQEFHTLAFKCGPDLNLHELLTLARTYGKQEGFEPKGVITLEKLHSAI